MDPHPTQPNRPLQPGQNVILIGMPGVGKSTIGVLLAKAMGLGFIDTDVYIQAGQGQTLQEIIREKGLDGFCRIEASYLKCLDARRCVIATGGSAVYSEEAMAALKSTGLTLHLDLPLEELRRRLGDLDQRGVVLGEGEDLEALYHRRRRLYLMYADLTIACAGKTHEQVLREIEARLVKGK